jgi:hypothetical protein
VWGCSKGLIERGSGVNRDKHKIADQMQYIVSALGVMYRLTLVA